MVIAAVHGQRRGAGFADLEAVGEAIGRHGDAVQGRPGGAFHIDPTR